MTSGAGEIPGRAVVKVLYPFPLMRWWTTLSPVPNMQQRRFRYTFPVSRFRLSRMDVLVLASLIFILVIQRIGFTVLGTGQTGTLFADALTVSVNLLAVVGGVGASRRGRGVARIFWLLFAITSAMQLVGNAGWAYVRYFHVAVPDSALFPSLFYRLAAAPMAIILFLSEATSSFKLQSYLDSAMVVGLVGLTTYQIQLAELNAHDPRIWQLITFGTAVNLVLLLAAIARLFFSTPGGLHGLFARQTIYLSIYLAVSFLTSFVDAYLPRIDASVDLIWILPYLSEAALAFTWRPPRTETITQAPRISRRAALLCFNLTLTALVLGSAVLGLRLVSVTRVVALVAVSVVLVAFAIRSALTQDNQEKYLAALQESRALLERQALYDELTGLPNRRLLMERMSQVFALAEREGRAVALLYLDLDGFKPVNDSLGHWVGDLLLKRVAHRMLSRIRKSDTLARMGGDEFTWLIPQLSSKEQAAQLAREMMLSLSEPFEIEGKTISITVSIGVSLFPENAVDPVELIQQADSAMYAVKRTGKNGTRYYTPGLEPPAAAAAPLLGS